MFVPVNQMFCQSSTSLQHQFDYTVGVYRLDYGGQEWSKMGNKHCPGKADFRKNVPKDKKREEIKKKTEERWLHECLDGGLKSQTTGEFSPQIHVILFSNTKNMNWTVSMPASKQCHDPVTVALCSLVAIIHQSTRCPQTSIPVLWRLNRVGESYLCT